MIACIYKNKALFEAKGKKFPMSVEKILQEAQRKIYQEFAYSLNIKEDGVPRYILDRIS